MSSFLVDLSSLLGDPGSSIEVDSEAPLDEMDVGDTHATFRTRPRVRAWISHTEIGLVVTGTVTTQARVDCSRCLEPFDLDIEAELEGGFLLPGRELPEGVDEDWQRVENDQVDLMPAILAALTIEIPFAPVHDESCKGICPTCGCNLNQEPCDCEAVDAEDPPGPFAALKDLVQDGE